MPLVALPSMIIPSDVWNNAKVASRQLNRTITNSSQQLIAGATVLVPAGLWWVAVNAWKSAVVNMEYQNSDSTWTIIIYGNAWNNMVISDGVHLRMHNTDATNTQTIVFIGYGNS